MDVDIGLVRDGGGAEIENLFDKCCLLFSLPRAELLQPLIHQKSKAATEDLVLNSRHAEDEGLGVGEIIKSRDHPQRD